ncbi:zinc finger, CCHC-type [Artemisia annua]|uniref:Zinc finger, CCHC-type n=1 Tax=Artemisia annua TaxID=35608 RepID=A0A2U1L072_ARTAN|nr:zinc finger, CCHC-type [Artemisia annua]
METILKAYGLWETINPKEGSSATDEKKMHTTKAMIFQTLPQDILMQVAQYETAKEVWNSVKVRYLDFSGKLGSIKAKFASLGTTLEDKIIVRKLLNSVPKKFLPIVATIEQYSEIDTMPFEEAVGRITAFEERIKDAEPEENDLSKLLIASSNKIGNWHNGRRRGDQGHGKGRGKGTVHEDQDKKKWRLTLNQSLV